MSAVDFGLLRRRMAFQRGNRIVIDFETRSEAKFGKTKESVGAYKYAEHPSTTILCMGYQINDGPVKIWWPFLGEELPEDVRECVEKGYIFEAHNAGFERAIWRVIVCRDHFVDFPHTWADTMAACAYRSLPMDLDSVNRVLKLAQKKDKRGSYLISKLCKPQKWTKKERADGCTGTKWCEDPELLRELGEYCMQDVRAEKALGEAIRDLPEAEYDVWCMDQEINDLGVYIDIEAVEAADRIREDVERVLTERLRTITNNAVTSGGELEKIKDWCASQDFPLLDMQADTIEEYLDKNAWNQPPDNVREVLRIRQTLSKASAKKLAKFKSMLCDNGRICGLLQYHGASTGRWAGRGLQPQNFPRPDEDLITLCEEVEMAEGMEMIIDALRSGDHEYVDALYGDPMNAIASALRGFIIAEPGNELYVADFSAIEARVLAWVAGEQWKLDAFAAIDRKEGYKGSEDIYLATASSVYGYPCLTKKTHKAERQTGKTCELAFGYQGGVGAWRKFDDSDKWSDEEVDEKKKAWRAAHSNIVAFWYEIEDTAVRAIQLRRPCRYRDIVFSVVESEVGDWLACKLPNGRCLWYYNPQLVQVQNPWTGPDGKRGWRWQVEYEGKDNKKGGAWGRIRTYGGMLTENIVQAISRDLMVEAMFRVRKAGYPIILTIHDEIISERLIGGGGSVKEFFELMSVVPDWARGLPIAVAGYVGPRYMKD